MSELQEPKPSLEDLLSVIIVQNQRIYDVLLVDLALKNEESFRNIVEKHKEMDNLGPAPFLMEE